MKPSAPSLSIAPGDGSHPPRVFAGSFRIGRGTDCEVRTTVNTVSRQHAELRWEDGRWWIIDLNSANGVFVNGERVTHRRQISEDGKELMLRLGPEGPYFRLCLLRKTAAVDPLPEEDLSSVTLFINRVMQSKSEHTDSTRMLFMQKAMKRFARRHSRRYLWLIALGCVILLGAGVHIWRQHHLLEEMQHTASGIFYSMKQLEIQIAAVESALGDSPRSAELSASRNKLRDLESQYDRFLEVNKIGVFASSLDDKERLVFRVARLFGECDVDMPREFIDLVMRYVQKWRVGEGLANTIERAQSAGYISKIGAILLAQDLPPQYVYLALQESAFNPRAIGPETYAGIAKGMWQFIPSTASRFGLRVGPLANIPRYDAADERFNFEKSTQAAARYLKRIYATDAQASGLLVMASYNWGEGKVVQLINKLPPNPKDRNFWQLLKHHRNSIPKESYEYVLRIVSAAVIGENPALFGFSFGKPEFIERGKPTS